MTVELSNNAETETSLTDVQQAALKNAQEELANYRQELETKKYLADVSTKMVNALSAFMNNEAPWKFTESLGVIEVQKELESCVKKGKLFMSAISFEALYYYISKIEGNGNTVNSKAITSMSDYIEIIKSINVVRKVIANENEKLKELEFIVASRAEGIMPDFGSHTQQ